MMAPQALAEESHPGLAAEAEYAEAVLAYNKKDYKAALAALNHIVKLQPRNAEALQLLALTYKTLGDTPHAYGAYRSLYLIQPPAQQGAAAFEMGVILYQQKKYPPAQSLFRQAVRLRFNPGPSHLFLGLMAFSNSQFSQAEGHFGYIARQPDPELSAVGHYYLGTIYLKNGFGGLGLGELIAASRIADRAPPESTTAKDIGKAAKKIVQPFDKGQWFASVTLIPQFDSNVGVLPVSGPGVTGLWTLRTNYSGGGGWMSSPMRLFQFVGSLRAAGNFNLLPLGSTVANYNYHNVTPSIYLTYDPMAHVSIGARAEGTFTINYSDDGTGGANRPFAMSGDGGLFLRWQPTGRFMLQLDGDIKPAYFFTNTDFTGWTASTKLSARIQSQWPLLNPGMSGGMDYNVTASDTWRYLAPAAEINNLFKIGSSNNLITSVGLTGYYYAWTARRDGNLVMRISDVHTIKKNWSILLDLSYTVNTSTEPTYSYNRYTIGLGAGWSL